MKKMKNIDKLLTNWLIAFTLIAFLLENIWSDVFTTRIALYSCLVNAIIMIAIKIICVIRKTKKNNQD